MLIDREVVDVDQQLLDIKRNNLGIEYTLHHKTFANINFVKFTNRPHSQIVWSGNILVTIHLQNMMSYKNGGLYKG